MHAGSMPDVRILLVEDNPVNQDFCLRVLRRLGCRAVAADSGIAALDILTEQSFDLVLMDCEMPEMDGFETTRRIRQSKMETADPARDTLSRPIPIIALTGYSADEIGSKHLAAGMDDALCKPFNEAQLAERLSRWLPGFTPRPRPAPKAVVTTIDRPPISAGGAIDLGVLDGTNAFKGAKGTALLKGLVAKFSAVVSRTTEAVGRALAERNAEEIRREAHGLKSSAAALGAMAVAQSCGELEASARSGQFDAMTTLIERLGRELPTAIQALGAYVAERESANVQ